MRRESKQYVEKLFKQFDKIGAGAIYKSDMKKLVETVVPETLGDPELEALLLQHVKSELSNLAILTI